MWATCPTDLVGMRTRLPRPPFLVMGLVAVALLGLLVAPALGSPERQHEREALRNPRLSADGLTLTVDLPGELQCGDQTFDGLHTGVDWDRRSLVVSAWTSRPDPSWCTLACPIYPADAVGWSRTASLTFEEPIDGFTLHEHPLTPSHCSDDLLDPPIEGPLAWDLPDN